MMYNNNYSMPYGYGYPYPGVQPGIQNGPTTPSIFMISSNNEVNSYLVAPNSTVYFVDLANWCLYSKSADSNGTPKVTVYDMVERKEEIPNTQYLTKEEFDAKIKELIKELKDDSFRKKGRQET